MTKTFTNRELSDIVQVLSDNTSFTKNTAIHPPFEIMWAVKVNLKNMLEYFNLINESKNEILQNHLSPECFSTVTNEDGEETSVPNPEYQDKFNIASKEMEALLTQTTEIDIKTFEERILLDFMEEHSKKISMPEFMVLEYFVHS